MSTSHSHMTTQKIIQTQKKTNKQMKAEKGPIANCNIVYSKQDCLRLQMLLCWGYIELCTVGQQSFTQVRSKTWVETLRLPISSDLPDSRNTSCPTYCNSSLCNVVGSHMTTTIDYTSKDCKHKHLLEAHSIGYTCFASVYICLEIPLGSTPGLHTLLSRGGQCPHTHGPFVCLFLYIEILTCSFNQQYL